MPEINGKMVILRRKLPAKHWWPLLPKLSKMGEKGVNPLDVLDWPTVCAMVAGGVESWEFEGEPADPEAVGALDTFVELTPLVAAIAGLIREIQQPKN